MNEPLLKIRGLSKSFFGIKVLKSVSMDVFPGQVVAIAGENGAGKSTLMKILMGEYQRDSGEIYLEGEEVHFTSPHQALSHGFSMIFQEMSPFPNMTVAENIYVGREAHKFIFWKRKDQIRDAQKLLDQLGINLDCNEKVRNLVVSEVQLLEIVKSVSYDSKIVIMDEPTSALTADEVKILFDIIANLKKRGMAILYISHKLDELFQVADRVYVLRDGEIVSDRPIDKVTKDVIISEMVGRKMENVFPEVTKKITDVFFEVQHLSRGNDFSDVSFSLKRGEILGIAGMVGSGRTEIVETIFGVKPCSSGRILLNGEEVKIRNPRDAIKKHFALVSEDRARTGLNLLGSIRSNICMTIIDKASRKNFFTDLRKERDFTEQAREKMQIRMSDQMQLVTSLSGGNQQKIVFGKWLFTDPEVFFLDEPTRGIDVGAKYEIYQLIQNLAKEGKGVVIISSEMNELIGICDRILVMKEGRLVGELEGDSITQEKIMSVIING